MTSPPAGFRYVADVLTIDEERALLGRLEGIELRSVVMHGVTAKRGVMHFGWDYGYDSWEIERTEPIPEWLLPIQARAGSAIGREPSELEQVLVARYPVGATIGWHRDAPMFGPEVVGFSLGGPVKMRFRPLRRMKKGERRDPKETFAIVLEPRSMYVIGGEARAQWQHSTSPVKSVRWSVTFRTLRG